MTELLGRNISRRRFLKTSLISVGAATCGGVLILNGGRSDEESLLSYTRRVANDFKILPIDQISQCSHDYPSERVQLAFSFQQYLHFFQYKKRVLRASRDEIVECVERFGECGGREKALILCAVFIRYAVCSYSGIHGRVFAPTEYLAAYEEFERRIRSGIRFDFINSRPDYEREAIRVDSPLETLPFAPSFFDMTPFNRVVFREYTPGRRPFYPFFYPATAFFESGRQCLLLGRPRREREIPVGAWKRIVKTLEKYASQDEEAIPGVPISEAEKYADEEQFDETLERLRGEPLFFPRNVYFGYPNGERAERELRLQLRAWFADVSRCVEMINTEFRLDLVPERWFSDFYPDAQFFLAKVAELEKDELASPDKTEIFVALREYWFSMQTWFPYERIDNYGQTGSGISPIVEMFGSGRMFTNSIFKCLFHYSSFPHGASPFDPPATNDKKTRGGFRR